jgi:hypothetical protein
MRKHVFIAGVCGMLLIMGFVVFQINRTDKSLAKIESPESVEELIQQLHEPQEKVKPIYFGIKHGPAFFFSPAMEKIRDRGPAIQPRLIEELSNTHIQNEIVIILSEIGNRQAIPALLKRLPEKSNLSDEERESATFIFHALEHITGTNLGLFATTFSDNFTENRLKWIAWWESNCDYLDAANSPIRTNNGKTRQKLFVDLEAKVAGQPTSKYRKVHPRVDYHEIETWRDDPAYGRKLQEYCYSVLLQQIMLPVRETNWETIRALGQLGDARSLSILHSLGSFAEDTNDADKVIRALLERGDPSSIPILEKIPQSPVKPDDDQTNETSQQLALERLRLLPKHGPSIAGLPLEPYQQIECMRCLNHVDGTGRYLDRIRYRSSDCGLAGDLHVAGYVKQDPVRQFLKQLVRDPKLDELNRTRAHASLARLGEEDSQDFLTQALTHKLPAIRLAAAEGFWRLGRRDGFQTLIDLIDVKPIETSSDGGEKYLDENVAFIRLACELLGEMGDPSAVEPLKRLHPIDLGGGQISSQYGSFTRRLHGRPDVVASAKLGDFSGVEVFRRAIQDGNPIDVAGPEHGYVAIGKKMFIPDLLPLLAHNDIDQRVHAVESILILMARGK